MDNTKEMRKRISTSILNALIENQANVPQEVRNVSRIILMATRKHPNLFTLPARSVGNFIIRRILVSEIRYRSAQCTVPDNRSLLNDVANIIDMVADSELTTLDEETNTIVSELRSSFTHELTTFYSYIEKRNAVNIAHYTRTEQDVPVALQKALQVFTQCRFEVEHGLDDYEEGKESARNVRAFFEENPMLK